MKSCWSVLAALLMLPSAAVAHIGVHAELEALSEKISEEPQALDLRLQRAQLYRRHGEYDKGLSDLTWVAAAAPDLPEMLLERGLTNADRLAFTLAEGDLGRYFASGRQSFYAYKAIAELRAKAGLLVEARRDYDKALRIQVTPDLLLARGKIDEEFGEWDRAAAVYRDGLVRLGDSVVIRLSLVRAEQQGKHYERALAALEPLLAGAGFTASHRLLRAEILEQAGRNEPARTERLRALAEMDEAVERRGTPLHRLTRARAYMALGRLDDAEQDLAIVRQTAPALVEIRELSEELARRRNASSK